MNQIEEHKKLVEFLHDVYVRKNHDYGDSFSRSFGKYGVTAALVRMEDKWNRLENLAGGAKQRVLDEGAGRAGHPCPGAGVSCQYVLSRPALPHRSAAGRTVRCGAHRHRQRRRAQLVVCAVPGAVQLCAGRLRSACGKRPCLRAVHPAFPAGGLGAPADCPAADSSAGGVTPHPAGA